MIFIFLFIYPLSKLLSNRFHEESFQAFLKCQVWFWAELGGKNKIYLPSTFLLTILFSVLRNLWTQMAPTGLRAKRVEYWIQRRFSFFSGRTRNSSGNSSRLLFIASRIFLLSSFWGQRVASFIPHVRMKQQRASWTFLTGNKHTTFENLFFAIFLLHRKQRCR